MAWSEASARLVPLKQGVTIAGGGLAGLSLAVALRLRDVPVTVLEAGAYPRHRVCGEFISGVSRETLEFLGIADLFHDAKRQSTLCWWDGEQVIHKDHLVEPALGISRYELDHRLQGRLLDLDGTLVTHHRAERDLREGHVWAAGRKARHGSWIGLKAHVRGLALEADLEMRSGSNGYAGLAPVEDHWVNVCGLFRLDRSLRAKGSALLPSYLEAGGSRSLAHRLRQCEWREGSFSAVAGFDLGRQPVEPGLFAIGDAESMIPPFTGNGMSMAFQAAETACPPLVAWSAGEMPWPQAVDDVRDALTGRFKKRLFAAKLFHQVLFNDAGRSVLRALSASHLLPFGTMLSFVR